MEGGKEKNHLLIHHITLVTNQNLVNVVCGMLFNVPDPVSDVAKGSFFGHIVHQQDTHGTTVIRCRKGGQKKKREEKKKRKRQDKDKKKTRKRRRKKKEKKKKKKEKKRKKKKKKPVVMVLNLSCPAVSQI